VSHSVEFSHWQTKGFSKTPRLSEVRPWL